ncbi:amino acid--tRNA ligase-related protein [Desulfosoma caldarium]|uniref:Lysyl-tRNA synthetase class 2 n=1 Tax=Desulfosoma caldarium TaxID=610254 RepID=A0A3N1UUQ5_9BACT|nr:amino acid--tRNA ligase-related protein [Desulfosoma caldarium]ROQ92277.1 lysyl-tRNA synthetase class 2 [Desulfosoma caldarium]
MTSRNALAAKRSRLALRSRILHGMRHFFVERGFLEVQTPVRTPAPAPEDHIDAMHSEEWYLQTSPELYMKRLLAAGYDKIFQICPVFRKGERGRRHHPEFTLLEWYRRGEGTEALMQDCQELLQHVCRFVDRFPQFSYAGQVLSVFPPWDRWTVRTAFQKWAGWDPLTAYESSRFSEDLVTRVEPHLGFPRPAFLCDYPPQEAALARLSPRGGLQVADRFELYWAGVELANGFSELTDREEQERRFRETLARRRQDGRNVYPWPHRFLESLDFLDAAAGIALGVDRLVMLLSDAPTLDDVVAFSPDHEP